MAYGGTFSFKNHPKVFKFDFLKEIILPFSSHISRIASYMYTNITSRCIKTFDEIIFKKLTVLKPWVTSYAILT